MLKIFCVLSVLLFLSAGWMIWRNLHPVKIGFDGEKLALCPASPNCVNSLDTNVSHYIKPFPIYDNGVESLNLLEKLTQEIPGSHLVSKDYPHMHLEFKSKFFGFIDDVDFLVDEDEKVINVRSAARVGYYDFDVNRTRIEQLRQLYLEKIGS